MALLFFDGFDYPVNTNVGDGLTLSKSWRPRINGPTYLNTSTDRYGGGALDMQGDGVVLEDPFNGQTEIVWGFDLWFENDISNVYYPSRVYANDIIVFQIISTSASGTQNDFHFEAYVNGVMTRLYTIRMIQQTWRYVEIRLRIGSSAALEIHVEKVPVYSNTNLNINSGGTLEKIEIFTTNTSSLYNMRINDFYLVDSLGTRNNTFLNMPRVRHLTLTGDSATANDLTESTGVGKFAVLEELPTNRDTDYVFGPLTAGLKQRCTGTHTQNNPIAGVNVVNVTKLTGSGVFQAQGNILLDNGTTEVTGLPADTNVDGQDYGATKGVVIEAAADGSDLTAAHLAAMEFGIEFVG